MKLSRPSRFATACIVLLSMLFMQLAMAGYVCPERMFASVPAAISIDADSMPGCDGLDMEQPSLCHAHAQADKQSLDRPELPRVQPFVAVTPAPDFHAILPAYRPIAVHADSSLMVRITAPPLSIRNCCFRI